MQWVCEYHHEIFTIQSETSIGKIVRVTPSFAVLVNEINKSSARFFFHALDMQAEQ